MKVPVKWRQKRIDLVTVTVFKAVTVTFINKEKR